MISAFRHEICAGRVNCALCLGIDPASVKWRQDQAKWLGVPVDWPCVCGAQRETLSKPDTGEPIQHLKAPRRVSFAEIIPIIEEHGSEMDKDECQAIIAKGNKCGCPETKAKNRLIADYRNLLKKRVLIVGNAPCSIAFDFGKYDHVVVFNRPKNLELFKQATYHFCRTNKPDLAYHAGEEFIPRHQAIPVLVEAGAHGKALAAKYADRGAFVFSCRHHAQCYEQGFTPSTGYSVIRYFIGLGFEITIAGFTWQGAPVHGWKFEKEECEKYDKAGIIKIERESI